MSVTENLSLCEIEGCGKQVSKKGYSLCYAHWLEASKRLEKKSPAKPSSQLTSTQLGERLGISSQKANQVLSELGWIRRDRKGWSTTEQGSKLLAEQREHHQTGIPFVVWPEAILTSRILTSTVAELTGKKVEQGNASETDTAVRAEKQPSTVAFREKFPPTHRATDGHWVRSKAEALIDNWLYMSGLVHAYERQLPVEEELYCDFYLPEGKVYIEYWGLENDPKYLSRKEAKRSIYKKYNFNLIELTEEHVKNLDDLLPKMLLKHNIIVS
jgi:hypothetical protein